MSLSEQIYIIVRAKERRTFWFGPNSPAPVANFIINGIGSAPCPAAIRGAPSAHC